MSRRTLSGSGVNDVTAVVLMAAHFEMPVCPHGGGKGLCNPIRRFALWDRAMALATCGESTFEHIDFSCRPKPGVPNLMRKMASTKDGQYICPEGPGWSLEANDDPAERHMCPDGQVWHDRLGPAGPASET